MSQATLALLRHIYDVSSGGDFDSAFEALAPDFELIPPSDAPVDGPLSSADAKAWLKDLWAMVGNPVMEVERLVDGEDVILALIRLRIRPASADAEFEQRIAHLWTLRDMNVVRCQVFLDRGQALEAAGLSEQDTRADS